MSRDRDIYDSPDIIGIPPMVLVKKLPNYAGPEEPLKPAMPGDAGMDLYAAENVVVEAEHTVAIPTGLKVAVPEGFELQVRSKSGLALKQGLMVANSPGCVDSGFRGEIMVIMHNNNPEIYNHVWGREHLGNSRTIRKGQKIAQAVIARYESPLIRVLDEGEELPESERGTGGFGSTGT